MITVDVASRIMALHLQLKGLNEHLAAIENVRDIGCEISIVFKVKRRDGRWSEETGLKHQKYISSGNDDALSSTILARLSDTVGSQKRAIERELAELGVRP